MAETRITREQLIERLNEDLAREYQAIIAYVVYSQVLKGAEYMNIAKELEVHAGEELQHALTIAKHIDYLGGMPTATALPVKLTENAKDMLRADLENENDTVRNYRERVKQCEALRRVRASPRTSARSCARSRSTRSISRPRWARRSRTSRERGSGSRAERRRRRLFLGNVLLHHLRSDFRAEDVAVGVRRHAFRAARRRLVGIRDRVGDERHDLPVARASDPDAALPTRIALGVRLRVRAVQHVVPSM